MKSCTYVVRVYGLHVRVVANAYICSVQYARAYLDYSMVVQNRGWTHNGSMHACMYKHAQIHWFVDAWMHGRMDAWIQAGIQACFQVSGHPGTQACNAFVDVLCAAAELRMSNFEAQVGTG